MNLTWHIAAKDLRRTGPAAAVWVASILGFALWFWFAMRVSPHYIVSRFSGEEVFTTIIRAIQMILALLMIGNAVLEDRLVGTDAFWLTRPIRRGQLLAGKALSAALLFIAAPLAVLIPLWLGIGFSAGELGSAAVEFVVPMVLILAFALMVGGLSASLGNFLFLVIVLAVVHLIFGAFAPTRGLTGHEAMSVRQSRNMLVQYGLLPGMALVAVHQFLMRDRRRSFALLAGLLLLTLVVRLAWPWAIVEARPEASAHTTVAARAKNPDLKDPSARLLGEIPVRVGAVFRNGASRTEIVELAKDRGNRPEAIIIRDTDAWLGLREGPGLREAGALARAKTVADYFLLKFPGGATPLHLPTDEAGIATYASLMVASRRLPLPDTLTAEQLAQATLMKVRFDVAQDRQVSPAGDKKP